MYISEESMRNGTVLNEKETRNGNGGKNAFYGY